ncbi:hypothetical protein N7530_002775 [Penicillium desertorum]|uniref:Ca2+-modulated nonselective cation channel polycystin n=1 Tax=Penicillium desertorum TaxID=1303715 RepID=A0A9W9X5C2_9EURO|nr:hypothetical protein N7530_002775 [Penicillium desertorum]
MTCTDKQSPRPLLHLPRRGWIPRALLPCLPLTFHKPERIVTRLPLQARMTTADGPARVHDRNARRRPFSNWVKRLANLKSSSDSTTNRWSNKRHTGNKGKKGDQENNPYPLSGTINRDRGTQTPTDSYTDDHYGAESRSRSDPSLCLGYENPAPLTSAKSAAPTISTNGDAAFSEAAYSKAGTLTTGTEGFSTHGGGEGSTFSSPAPSIRSMTTTLTTSPPHLVPQSHAMTYSAATANNALTDNASLLTLASSSKRRRRNSLDTNASVRGLAPSSVFGGSRESLPLSVLSGNTTEASNTSVFNASGVLSRPSIVGLASAERISVYSASGAIPLASTTAERGGLYTTKQTTGGDTASIRSGVQSHSRNDSTAASIAGGISSPLAMTGRMSRRSSGWGEITGEEGNDGKPVEKNEDEAMTKDEHGFSVERLRA